VHREPDLRIPSSDPPANATQILQSLALNLGPTIAWCLVLLTIATSLSGIGRFATIDEENFWHGKRIPNFWLALGKTDEASREALEVCNKPGKTTVWFSGLGQLLPGPWQGSISSWPQGDTFALSAGIFDWGQRTPFQIEMPRMEMRDRVRAQQRLGCYLACAVALIFSAWCLRKATTETSATPSWYLRYATPLLALILLADPIIRNNIRLALTDGLMGAFAMLGVCAVAFALSEDHRVQRRASLAYAMAGSAMAFAMLSKYSAIFALASVSIAMFLWAWYHAAAKTSGNWKDTAQESLTALVRMAVPYALGFVLVAYVLQPLAWTDPAYILNLFQIAEFASGVGVPWLFASALVLCLLAVLLLSRLRGPILRILSPTLIARLCIVGSAAIALAILAGLCWQHGKPIVYNHELVESPDHFSWYMENTYTFEVGELLSRVLNTRWMMTTLANTLPEHVVLLLLATPFLLLWALRRLDANIRMRFCIVMLLLQLYFFFSATIQGPGLLPLGIRYQLHLYFPLVLLAGLAVLVTALALKKFAALPLVLATSAVLFTHLSTLNVYDDYLNAFRSREVENAFALRADGVVMQDFIAVDGIGAYMVEAAQFLNQKYLEQPEDKREGFRVFIDSPTYKPFAYHTFTKNPKKAYYQVRSRASLYRSPELVELLKEQEPVLVIEKQGVPFIWVIPNVPRISAAVQPTVP